MYLPTYLPIYLSTTMLYVYIYLYKCICIRWSLFSLALSAQQPRVAAQLQLASASGTHHRLFCVAGDKCVVGTALLQPLGALRARMSIG